MAAISDTLRTDLRDREFSEGYAESFLDTYVATQIKVLREQNQLTQSQLAERLGTTQTVISRIENINYSAWNIGTLKKLARAFNVRLHVSFESYGSLIDDFQKFSRKALQRVPRDRDPILLGAPTESDLNALIQEAATIADEKQARFVGQRRQIVNAASGTPKSQMDFAFGRSLHLVFTNERGRDSQRKSQAMASTAAYNMGASGAQAQVQQHA